MTIDNVDTVPEVTGTVDGQDCSATLDAEIVQALGQALTDLLPVADSEPLVVCKDNYPDWQITLIYRNGATAKLASYGSTIHNLGGPWWVELDDQFRQGPTGLRSQNDAAMPGIPACQYHEIADVEGKDAPSLGRGRQPTRPRGSQRRCGGPHPSGAGGVGLLAD